MPASLTAIADDAVQACPLAAVQAPEGSLAASFALKLANSVPLASMFETKADEYDKSSDLSELVTLSDVRTYPYYKAPGTGVAVYRYAKVAFVPAGVSSLTDITWGFLAPAGVTMEAYPDGDEPQLRVLIESSCSNGVKDIEVFATYGAIVYATNLTINVQNAPSTDFDTVFTLLDSSGNTIPDTLYQGEGSEAFTANLALKSGTGLESARLTDVYLENSKPVSVIWQGGNENPSVTITVQAAGTTTLHVIARATYGYNEIQYERKYPITVSADTIDLPRLLMPGPSFEQGRFITSVNCRFRVICDMSGDNWNLFINDLKLRALSAAGIASLVSDYHGDSADYQKYHFSRPGVFPVMYIAHYRNLTVSTSFYIVVKNLDDSMPSADFDSYFGLDYNADGYDGGLYFAPDVANEARICSIQLWDGAPFTRDAVALDVSYLAPEGTIGTVGNAVIRIAPWSYSDVSADFYALPSTHVLATAGVCTYRVTAITPLGVFTKNITVNMQSIDTGSLPAKAAHVTNAAVDIPYSSTNTYDVPWPGFDLGGGKAFPAGAVGTLYHVDRWGKLEQWRNINHETFSNVIMQGQPYTQHGFRLDQPQVLTMRYVVRLGNLSWSADFKLCFGVPQNDASALFNISSQTRTVLLGGIADEWAWGGNFVADERYNIVDCGATYVSGADSQIGFECPLTQGANYTELHVSIKPRKVGTTTVRLWALVDDDNNSATAPVEYTHNFTYRVVATPKVMPTGFTLTNGDQITVNAREAFALPPISNTFTAYNQYGIRSGLYDLGNVELNVSGELTDDGATDATFYWVNTPGRYRLSREVQFGANYTLRHAIMLTVLDEETHAVEPTVLGERNWNAHGWDDTYQILPGGNVENNLIQCEVWDLSVSEDADIEWGYVVDASSTGKFADLRFPNAYAEMSNGYFSATLVGMYPSQTGDVTVRVTFNAYEGEGAARTLVYTGQSEPFTFHIVDTREIHDFHFVQVAKLHTYQTSTGGTVHIDALDVASSNWALPQEDVRTEFLWATIPNGASWPEIVYTYASGDTGKVRPTGCDVYLDPAVKGSYTITQHSWVSLDGVDLSIQAGIRIIVGSTTGLKTQIHEDDINLSIINLRDSEPDQFRKTYTVYTAQGDTINWAIVRQSGTSADISFLLADGTLSKTATSVVGDDWSGSDIQACVTNIASVGTSKFQITAKVTTVSGVVYIGTLAFSVKVVDQAKNAFLPTLTPAQTVYEAAVGEYLTIPQPVMAYPSGVAQSTVVKRWIGDDSLNPYPLVVDAPGGGTATNLLICAMEPGFYSVSFCVMRGLSTVRAEYGIIVSGSGGAPVANPTLRVVDIADTRLTYTDTDHDGIIPITASLPAGAGIWRAVASIYTDGYTPATSADRPVYTLSSPDNIGVYNVKLVHLYGKLCQLYARYSTALDIPRTFQVAVSLHGTPLGTVAYTLQAPVAPVVLEGLGEVTLTAGMTYQLDTAAFAAGLGQAVTAYTCEYVGQTAKDKRFTVSPTGLITVTAKVSNARVFVKTANAALLAMVDVIVKDDPATLSLSVSSFTFTMGEAGTVTVAAINAAGQTVPAAIAATSKNVAVATVAPGENPGEFVVTAVKPGRTAITLKAQKGAAVELPVAVEIPLTSFGLSYSSPVYAGISDHIYVNYGPENTTDRNLIWSWVFAAGADTSGFDNSWITLGNGVLTVSPQLDRVITITVTATPTRAGVSAVSYDTTLLPQPKRIDIREKSSDHRLVQVGGQYVAALSSDLTVEPIALEALYTPAGIQPNVLWSSSVPAVATINSHGEVTLLSAGTTVITAKPRSGYPVKGSITLTVRTLLSAVGILSPRNPLTMVAGVKDAVTLATTYEPLNANVKNVTWSVQYDAADAATPFVDITSKGVVSINAKWPNDGAAHNVTITATAADGAQGVSASVPLAVLPKTAALTITGVGATAITGGTVMPIQMDIGALTLHEGVAPVLQLTYTQTPSVLTGSDILWTSSNPGAANVTGNRVDGWILTLLKPAKGVTITATATDGSKCSDSFKIDIVTKPTAVYLDGSSVIARGKAVLYTATVSPASASQKVTWSVYGVDGAVRVDKPSGVSINASGLLSATAPTYTKYIVEATSQADPGKTAIMPVRITSVPTNITFELDTPDTTLDFSSHDDYSLNLYAYVTGAEGTKPSQKVAWSTSDPKVLKVVNEACYDPYAYGTFVAMGVGKATVTATTTDGSNIKRTYENTIEVIATPSSVYSHAVPDSFVAGQTFVLKPYVTPPWAPYENATWTLSDTPGSNAATLSANGVLKALEVETSTPIVIYVNLTCTFAVCDPISSGPIGITIYQKPKSITLQCPASPDQHYIDLGSDTPSLWIDATVGPGSALQEYDLTSSNPKVARVEHGSIIPVSVGDTIITATVTGNRKIKATYPISVGVMVGDIQLSAPATTLPAGGTLALQAKCMPANATNKKLIWTTSNAAVATVSATGVVTAKKIGAAQTVRITATAADSKGTSNYIDLRVRPQATGIQLMNGPDMLDASSVVKLALPSDIAAQLTAVCSPYQESTPEVNALQGVVWSSSDPKTVFVGPSGDIYAQKCGTAIIKATATDGSKKTASVKVLVNGVPDSIDFTLPEKGALGKKLTLAATISPGGVPMPRVVWTLEGDSARYATLTTAGVLTLTKKAADIGKTVTVKAAITFSNGGTPQTLTALHTLTIAPPVTSIITNESSIQVHFYQEQHCLSAVCLPAAAGQAVVWSTSNGNIADVDKNGLVTFVNTGKVTITATAADGSGVKKAVTLTILP